MDEPRPARQIVATPIKHEARSIRRLRRSVLTAVVAGLMFGVGVAPAGASSTLWTASPPFSGPWAKTADSCPTPTALVEPDPHCAASAAGTDEATGQLQADVRIATLLPGDRKQVGVTTGGPAGSFTLAKDSGPVALTFVFTIDRADVSASNPAPNATEGTWADIEFYVAASASSPGCADCLGSTMYEPWLAATSGGEVKWSPNHPFTVNFTVGRGTLPAGTVIDTTVKFDATASAYDPNAAASAEVHLLAHLTSITATATKPR